MIVFDVYLVHMHHLKFNLASSKEALFLIPKIEKGRIFIGPNLDYERGYKWGYNISLGDPISRKRSRQTQTASANVGSSGLFMHSEANICLTKLLLDKQANDVINTRCIILV